MEILLAGREVDGSDEAVEGAPLSAGRALAGGQHRALVRPQQPGQVLPATARPGTKKLLQYPGAPFATLPAGQTPELDVENAIDNIFHHPNVGPFVVKQLIQRLVTSNPTPGYVQRVVATVFNDNGSHVRGDMKAVIRAILLDGEARSATVAAGDAFGKLREPVAKFLHLHRAFNARTSGGYYDIWDLSDPDELGQAPLRAPSVFNFYGADFAPAGPITRGRSGRPRIRDHVDLGDRRLLRLHEVGRGRAASVSTRATP